MSTMIALAADRIQEIETLATGLLSRIGVAQAPINATAVASALGAEVRVAEFQNRTTAAAVRKKNGKATIYVAPHSAERRRFSICHEIGHLVLHIPDQADAEHHDTDYQMFRSSVASVSEDVNEMEASRFSAAILMPRNLIEDAYRETQSVEKLAELFKVSRQAMSRRLSELGYAL